MNKSVFSDRYRRFLGQLKSARIEAGLSQTEAAKRVGRPQSFISKCESGERRVDVVELSVLCDIYGVDVLDFLRGLFSSGSS